MRMTSRVVICRLSVHFVAKNCTSFCSWAAKWTFAASSFSASFQASENTAVKFKQGEIDLGPQFAQRIQWGNGVLHKRTWFAFIITGSAKVWHEGEAQGYPGSVPDCVTLQKRVREQWGGDIPVILNHANGPSAESCGQVNKKKDQKK